MRAPLVKNTSRRPSLSKSRTATPPRTASITVLSGVVPLSSTKSIPEVAWRSSSWMGGLPAGSREPQSARPTAKRRTACAGSKLACRHPGRAPLVPRPGPPPVDEPLVEPHAVRTDAGVTLELEPLARQVLDELVLGARLPLARPAVYRRVDHLGLHPRHAPDLLARRLQHLQVVALDVGLEVLDLHLRRD